MCEISDCSNAARARRMCVTHYNRRHRYGDPLAGPVEVAGCLQCGQPTPKSERGPRASYCSTRCRDRSQYLRTTKARRPTRRKAQRALTCDQCGDPFTSARMDARFCTKRCSSAWQRAHAKSGCSVMDCPRPLRAKGMCNLHYRQARGEKQLWTDKRRDAYHQRRAQKKATANDRPVLLAEIRERDGNRCHLCRKKVSVKPYPHPLSPSLDHIVPLSLDGEHVPENVRLAHLVCNTAKGNRGGNEQLLLIG